MHAARWHRLARPLSAVALVALFLVALLLAAFALRSPVAVGQTSTASTYPTVKAVAKHPKAVFIGGSFTAGDGASRGSKSWATLIARSRGWDAVNLASKANDLFSLPANCANVSCPDYKTVVADVVHAAPRVVVFGAQLDTKSDAKTVSATAALALSALRDALPQTLIIAVGPTGPPGSVDTRMQALDGSFRAAATAAGATYVSLLEPVGLPASDFAPGASNPDDAGQAAIAIRIAQALSQ